MDDLASETISPLLASVILTFKRIEDKLPDFSGRSAGLFRNYWGINRSYHQWSTEEGQHSDAAQAVLVGTGSNSEEELLTDYEEALEHTWEPPYPGEPRKMVLYAALQETVTGASYESLAARARREGAPLVAEIMHFISRDERFHSGGYRLFSQVFAQLDLHGAIDDALQVAAQFRMPAQHLMLDPRRNSMEIARVGAFGKKLVTAAIEKTLGGLKFVPDDLVGRAAASYWAS
jgi:hypothetical protein